VQAQLKTIKTARKKERKNGGESESKKQGRVHWAEWLKLQASIIFHGTMPIAQLHLLHRVPQTARSSLMTNEIPVHRFLLPFKLPSFCFSVRQLPLTSVLHLPIFLLVSPHLRVRTSTSLLMCGGGLPGNQRLVGDRIMEVADRQPGETTQATHAEKVRGREADAAGTMSQQEQQAVTDSVMDAIFAFNQQEEQHRAVLSSNPNPRSLSERASRAPSAAPSKPAETLISEHSTSRADNTWTGLDTPDLPRKVREAQPGSDISRDGGGRSWEVSQLSSQPYCLLVHATCWNSSSFSRALVSWLFDSVFFVDFFKQGF
jgi:hypothetical protein